MRGIHASRPIGVGVSRARRGSITGLLLVFVLIAASCSGDEESSAETLAPAGTEATSSSTTTEAPTTTTTVAPTSTTVSAEDEVLAVHERFMTEFFARDESELTFQERTSRVAAIAIDPLLARTLESLADRNRDGSYAISPGYDSNVIEVQVDGDTAFVLDCSLDQGVLFDASGEVLIEADEDHRVRRTVFALTGGGWFVSDFITGGEPCEPST